MEKLQIRYGIQGNGITFRLLWSTYKIIKEVFPDAQPSKGIFVEYDMREDFAQNHAHLEKYIFPALVGLADEKKLKYFKIIEFIKTPQEIVTYTLQNE
jgi:hypothetical protein